MSMARRAHASITERMALHMSLRGSALRFKGMWLARHRAARYTRFASAMPVQTDMFNLNGG